MRELRLRVWPIGSYKEEVQLGLSGEKKKPFKHKVHDNLSDKDVKA